MKLVIADDHDLVREALAILIERDQPGSEVLQASTYPEARALAAGHDDLDLVLLDVYMPGMNGLESVREITEEFADLPVVLMSGEVRKSVVDTGFEYGARGFIPKTMSGKALVSALSLVMAGTRYVPDFILEQGPGGAGQGDIGQGFDLSPRELEVLDRLALGLSNKAIARKLGIEETTVKLHLRSLFRKLDVGNRTEAVVKARDAGLCRGGRL